MTSTILTTPAVFLSYARASTASVARALRDALTAKGITVFLDETGVELGDRFPRVLAEALLGSRVVVILTEPSYFTRWYCLWEWRATLTPYLRVCERPSATEAQQLSALEGIVLALPPDGTSTELDRFPPELRENQWARVTDLDAVASHVERELARVSITLGERIQHVVGDDGLADVRAELIDAASLPFPRSLQGIPRVPMQLLPSLGDRFVGRSDDLWRIDHVLVNRIGGVQGAAALSGALQGLGGVGKTRLALEYVHRLGPLRFPGGIFWISGQLTDTELEAVQHQILVALSGSSGTAPPTLAEYRDGSAGRMLIDDLVRAFDALPPDRHALVVIDDLPDPTQAPATRQHWAPMHGLAAVLTTSRLRVAGEGDGAISLSLDVLTTEAAVRLLTFTVGVGGLTRAQWVQIAEWVGRLPLALTLLNAVMTAHAISPAEVLERALSRASQTTELDRSMDALRSSVPPGSLRGVTEAFAAAYERLPREAQRAARILAHGAPVALPEQLMAKLGPDVFAAATRALLITRSWLTPIEAGSPPVFGVMHAVLADYLRVQAERAIDTRECLETFANAIHEVFLEASLEEPSNWPLLDACMPHLVAVVAGASQWATLDLSVIRLLLVRGKLFEKLGVYAEAREVLSRGLQLVTSSLGRDSDFAVLFMLSLSNVLSVLEEGSEALSLAEEGNEIAGRIFGPDDLLTTLCKSNLAGLLTSPGELPRARRLAEEAVETAVRTMGPEDQQTLNFKSQLAHTMQVQGDMLDSINLSIEIFTLRAKVLGANHPRTLETIGTLGEMAYVAGDLDTSRMSRERYFKGTERLFGRDHPRTLTTMNELATTLTAQGTRDRAPELFDQARRLLSEVVAGRTRHFGADHASVIVARYNLAVVDLSEGLALEAQAAFEELVEPSRRSFGPESMTALQVLSSLAVSVFDQGKFEEARALQESVLLTLRRVSWTGHPQTVRAMVDLARTLDALGAGDAGRALRDEAADAVQRPRPRDESPPL